MVSVAVTMTGGPMLALGTVNWTLVPGSMSMLPLALALVAPAGSAPRDAGSPCGRAQYFTIRP